jgi:hypothetical protein
MKNLLIAILLIFQVSCGSRDIVDSATTYESVIVYKLPMSLHNRYPVDEESIKEMDQILEKQRITHIDSLIIFNRIVNSLIPSDFNYNDFAFDPRVLCEISTGSSKNNNLLINTVGDIKYKEKYYNKSKELFRFLQIQY